jgi:peptidase M23B
MKKKINFFRILVYTIVPVIFLVIIYGIYRTDYNENEKSENISGEILKIPNSNGNTGDFEYDSYIVSEEISITDLALKLKKDVRILQYNNPVVLKNPLLKPGTRIIVYKEPVIFYKIKDGDTLSMIASKFQVSKESIININSDIAEENLSNKKYLVIKNPVINDNIIAEKGMEEISSFVDLSVELNKGHNKNDLINKETIISDISNKRTKSESTKNNYRNEDNSENIEVKVIMDNENNQNDFEEEEIKITKEDIRKLDLSKIESYELYWPVVSTKITSEFGNRMHPVLKENRFHRGVDISSVKGAAVNSGVKGIVTYAGVKGNYGNMIEVRRSDGLKVRYAHLSKIEVRVGQRIQEGDKIGEVGSTGMATGPHLHYEVLIEDIPVDPMKFKYR